jgi:hypothetical protein
VESVFKGLRLMPFPSLPQETLFMKTDWLRGYLCEAPPI